MATVTPDGKPTMMINRNPDGSIASIVSSERAATIARDAEGDVEGTTVTDA